MHCARALVIEAGYKLLESELVARTWGNISVRISDTEFVITPSGRAYETLTPADLVKVRIDDLSYTGNIKPSSEKGIHADAYALRPDVNFVIHTHQLYASAIGVEDQDMPFAPFTIWMEHALSDVRGWNEYVVLAINMILNLGLEYLWDNFVVYRDSKDTNDIAQKKKEKE